MRVHEFKMLKCKVKQVSSGGRVIYKIIGDKKDRNAVVNYLNEEFPPNRYNTFVITSSEHTEVWRDDD